MKAAVSEIHFSFQSFFSLPLYCELLKMPWKLPDYNFKLLKLFFYSLSYKEHLSVSTVTRSAPNTHTLSQVEFKLCKKAKTLSREMERAKLVFYLDKKEKEEKKIYIEKEKILCCFSYQRIDRKIMVTEGIKGNATLNFFSLHSGEKKEKYWKLQKESFVRTVVG